MYIEMTEEHGTIETGGEKPLALSLENSIARIGSVGITV